MKPKSLNSIFPQYFEDLKKSERSYSLSESVRPTRKALEVANSSDTQQIIRPLFGKEGVSTASIGGHPDFDYLANTENTEKSSIVTMFIDMESSTRLGVLYNPEDVFRIKNAFIRMAIDVVKSLDGHVHRIMGDAVMAFFGGKQVEDEAVIVDALNCASALVYLVKNSVIPQLTALGYDRSDFGIRVGIDYGKVESVLWSSYGHYNISEVTATSFYVDVASKLQGSAGRNEIVIGQSLKEFIDFPEEYLEVKTYMNDGVEKKEPFITPNFTLIDGTKINYRKFVLRSEEYLNSILFPVKVSASQNDYLPAVTNHFILRVDRFNDDQITYERTILPGTVVISKKKWIKFTFKLNQFLSAPIKVKFEVVNHGKEASEGGKNSSRHNDNHETNYELTHYDEEVVHWEHTKYRGFHNLYLTVIADNKLIHEIKLGIYIK